MTLATTSDLLGLLATLTDDNVEQMLPIAADILDELGRSEDGAWCRQWRIEKFTNVNAWYVSDGSAFPPIKGMVYDYRAFAVSELFRYVRERFTVPCNRNAALCPKCSGQTQWRTGVHFDSERLCYKCWHSYDPASPQEVHEFCPWCKGTLLVLRPRRVPCPRCGGRGEERYCDAAGDMDDRTCPACQGTGTVEER